MIETKNVRYCNEPFHNAGTTVLNWTSGRSRPRISESRSRKFVFKGEGVFMKTNASYSRGSSRIAWTVLALAALILLSSALVLGQEVTASLTGTVTDPSGAAIPSAAVTATDADRGTVWKTQSNSEGTYVLPRLPIGRYEVRVEVSGFQTAVHAPFSLELNQAARIDFAMTIGQVSQQMEVSAAAPLLQTETTSVSSVMEASAIANLPLETRNYNQLALLVPGAVTISPDSFNTGL